MPALLEYLPFVVLLFALYTVSGGIGVFGDLVQPELDLDREPDSGLRRESLLVESETKEIDAGVAVAAYGSFFNMPWQMVAAPIILGMAAHAVRWELLQHGSV